MTHKIKGLRPIKARTKEAICVLTIAVCPSSSPEHRNRIAFLKGRMDAVKAEANKRGFNWFKTEWATSLIEKELSKVEKQFGIRS